MHSDHDNLLIAIQVGETNARAIESLTRSVDELAKLMAKEDKRQSEILSKLMTNAEKCELRHKDFLRRFDIKQEELKRLSNKIESRVEQHVFERVVNRLWTIGGAVIAIMVGSMGYLIKEMLERLGGS